MLNKFVVLLIIISISGILTITPSIRIVNGFNSSPGQFPYQASIQASLFSKPYRHVCGGAIIAPLWILTAAHCNNNNAKFKVLAGITDLTETNAEREERQVVQFINHPDYVGATPTDIDDIALMELDAPLEYNQFLQPIKLPAPGSEIGGKAMVSGWGTIDSFRLVYPNHLQFLEVPILDHSTCFVKSGAYLKEKQICTGPLVGKGTCAGDSGGPLVQNGEIIGVVSYGTKHCAAGVPDYFTKVSSYIDFIESHIKPEN